jgi:colanic acid biosynthesis glycosyl transferase WcaI
MRILFLSENFPPETNAAATRVHERAIYWVRAGHQVTVITQAPNFPFGRVYEGYRNRWRQAETIDGIRVVRVKTYIAPNQGVIRRSLDFVSFMATAVPAGLREERPDVVAATSPQFFAAVAGWMIGALRRVPFVFELGDLWPASIAAVGAMRPGLALRVVEKMELFLYRRSAAVVALTGAFKNNLVRRGISPEKIAVVVNGVDIERYGPRERDMALAAEWNLKDRFTIGYVGTHGMAHGLENVIRAAAILGDEGQDGPVFVFAGPGAARDGLVASATEQGLKNVVFIPPQPKERMPAIWSLCDVALVHLKDSPVFAEVIPSKIFEAMAMGLPILIAAPPGEATRIIERENAGLVVPAEDPGALADAVRKLASDETLRRRLAAASHAAAPRYSRQFQADAMMEALKAAAAGDGGSAAARVAALTEPGP